MALGPCSGIRRRWGVCCPPSAFDLLPTIGQAWIQPHIRSPWPCRCRGAPTGKLASASSEHPWRKLQVITTDRAYHAGHMRQLCKSSGTEEQIGDNYYSLFLLGKET